MFLCLFNCLLPIVPPSVSSAVRDDDAETDITSPHLLFVASNEPFSKSGIMAYTCVYAAPTQLLFSPFQSLNKLEEKVHRKVMEMVNLNSSNNDNNNNNNNNSSIWEISRFFELLCSHTLKAGEVFYVPDKFILKQSDEWNRICGVWKSEFPTVRMARKSVELSKNMAKSFGDGLADVEYGKKYQIWKSLQVTYHYLHLGMFFFLSFFAVYLFLQNLNRWKFFWTPPIFSLSLIPFLPALNEIYNSNRNIKKPTKKC